MHIFLHKLGVKCQLLKLLWLYMYGVRRRVTIQVSCCMYVYGDFVRIDTNIYIYIDKTINRNSAINHEFCSWRLLSTDSILDIAHHFVRGVLLTFDVSQNFPTEV